MRDEADEVQWCKSMLDKVDGAVCVVCVSFDGGVKFGACTGEHMCKAYVRHVQGMHKACVRHVQGMYKACVRHVQVMYKA
eukprot:1160814-Pelagomonas_calceolata.AAC.1